MSVPLVSLLKEALTAQALLICTGTVCVLLWTRKKWQERNYPPNAPGSLPLVGHLLTARKFKRHLGPMNLFPIVEAVKKPIFRFRPMGILSPPIYFITDMETAKEVFVTNKALSSGRPRNLIATVNTSKDNAIAAAEGAPLMNRRKIIHQSMRKLGLGKTALENSIKVEAEKLIEYLKSIDMKRVSMELPLARATTNVICSMAIGRRFEYSDQAYATFFEQLQSVTKVPLALSHPGTNMALPKFIREFFRKRYPAIDERIQFTQAIVDFGQQYLEEHKSDSTIEDTFIRDFLTVQKTNPTDFSDLAIKMSLKDLFVAGSDTSSTTLDFCTLHLTADQELQQTLYDEICEKLSPNLSDLTYEGMGKTLPLTSAFINEVMRHNPVAPITVPHQTRGKVHLKDGTIIPAGCTIFGMTMYINKTDPQFKDPAHFNLENFLNSEGEFENHQMLNFGIGPRSCVGEKLARVELMVFLVYLVKHFRFLPVEGEVYDRDEGLFGLTQFPKPYLVELSSRET